MENYTPGIPSRWRSSRATGRAASCCPRRWGAAGRDAQFHAGHRHRAPAARVRAVRLPPARRVRPWRRAAAAEILAEVRREVSVIQLPAWNRFPQSLATSSPGGHAAVNTGGPRCSRPTRSARSRRGGMFDRGTANRFLESILSRGGSRDAPRCLRRVPRPQARHPVAAAAARHRMNAQPQPSPLIPTSPTCLSRWCRSRRRASPRPVAGGAPGARTVAAPPRRRVSPASRPTTAARQEPSPTPRRDSRSCAPAPSRSVPRRELRRRPDAEVAAPRRGLLMAQALGELARSPSGPALALRFRNRFMPATSTR